MTSAGADRLSYQIQNLWESFKYKLDIEFSVVIYYSKVCTFIVTFPFEFLDNFSSSDGKNIVSSSKNSAKSDE